MTYEKIFSNIDIDRQAKNVLEIEYEQNKGREASSGADDTSVLQEDGRQPGEVMRWAGPRMISYHPVAAIKHIIREL